MTSIPRLLEPQDLQSLIADHHPLVIVDLCNQALYNQKHVQGAVHLPGNALVAGTPPVPGAHPGVEQLNKVVNHLGIDDSKHVVLYDDEGGGWAGRLAWSLDLLGLTNWSYLNGGIVPWIKEGFTTEAEANQPQSISTNTASEFINPHALINTQQIMASLDSDNFAVWDARSPDEYSGTMEQHALDIFPALLISNGLSLWTNSKTCASVTMPSKYSTLWALVEIQPLPPTVRATTALALPIWWRVFLAMKRFLDTMVPGLNGVTGKIHRLSSATSNL